ncbi:MAG: hypothetical protein OFPII_23880 [Osedax symbiont Rs1]|nr:MAG: hypothetical protein OFPII_23880 [Osedax symbiont Rs1]
MKLHIEIEQLKKNSGLNPASLSTLDQKTNDLLLNISHQAITPLQKLLAIPLAFLFIINAFLGLQLPAEEMDSIETMLGLGLILPMIYIGF